MSQQLVLERVRRKIRAEIQELREAVVNAAAAAGVPTSRTLTAGTGLTGGGDLTTNRSFAADFGTTTGKVMQGDDARWQPVDSDLTAIAALTTTSFGRALLALADAAALRTAAALGDVATHAASEFQPADSDLTAIAALTTTSFGRSFLDRADAAAARTLLGLGGAALLAVGTTAGTVAAGDDSRLVTLKSRRDVMLTAGGIITENLPFESISGSSACTTQTVFGYLLGLNAGDVVTNCLCLVVTAGVGTAPTTIRLGLADPSGNIVASSANVASNAAWTTANTVASIALSAPYTVPTTGGYRWVIVQNGAFATTAMTLGRPATLPNATASAAMGGGIRRIGIYGNTQTDLPNVGSALAASGGTITNFWCAVN